MKLFSKLFVSLLLVATCWGTALADFVVPPGTGQAEFNAVVTEAGRLTAYRSMMPAEPGGWTGFDIGIAISGVEVEESLWQQFNVDEDALAVPRLIARKGLPFNLDVGAFYAEVNDYDLSLYGVELQWAILDGTAATPALALRGSYTELDAAGEVEVTTTAADLVVSKGLAMLTPYAGIGIVNFDGEYTGAFPLGLEDFDDDETRIFAGLQFAIALLNFSAEYEQMDEPVYSLKMSLGW